MIYATPAAIIVVSVLFPVLGMIAVFLRFYTRSMQKGGFGIDDWLIIPALVLEIVLAGLMLWGAAEKSLGLPIPAPNVPGPEGFVFSLSPQQIRFEKIQYFFHLFSVFAFGLIKLSILFFYRKIFCSSGIKKSIFDQVIKAAIAFIIAWTIAFGFGAIFLCKTEPSAAWGSLATIEVKCVAQLPFLEGLAISDFITDSIILILPLPMIWYLCYIPFLGSFFTNVFRQLHMPMRRKIGVSAVFLVGILALAASATRMAIYVTFIVDAFSQPDGETLVTVLLFWSMIECGLGVFVACLPTLRPLLGRISPDAILSSLRSAFSLHSIRAHSSPERTPVRSDSLEPSTSSHTGLCMAESLTTPWYDEVGNVRDLENQAHGAGGQIVVKTQITQSARHLSR